MIGRAAPLLAMFIAGILPSLPAAAQPSSSQGSVQQQGQSALRMGSKPQEVLFTKISVSDLPRSVEFYTKIMGLKLVTSPDIDLPKPPAAGAPEQDYASVTLNYSGSMADAMLVLIKRRGTAPSRESARLIIIGLKVPNTRAAMEAARRAGHEPTRPFGGEGRPGHISDPDGYGVEIVQALSFQDR